MAHSLHQMTEDDTQWEELMRSMVEAFENPMQSMFRLFRPVLEPGPQADEASYQEFKHRMQFEYGADGIWQKVINQDGKLVGGALWKIFYQNPFAKHQDETVYWYPEGGARDFASGALELFEGPRRKWGTRPQVCMSSEQKQKGIRSN